MKKTPATSRKGRLAVAASMDWDLRLCSARPRPKSVAAFRSLKQRCEEDLAGRYHIDVIDLMKNPQLAQGDQILAMPTPVRKLSQPIHKVIGSLSNTERILVGLDLRPHDVNLFTPRKGEKHVG